MNANLHSTTRSILTALGLACALALTLGCETGDPAIDGAWDIPMEELEGELQISSATRLENGEALDTSGTNNAITQPDYTTCLEGCMDAGGSFNSCHDTCLETFPVHYQSCMENCMLSGGSFSSCHRSCKPPKPAPEPAPKPADKAGVQSTATSSSDSMASTFDGDTDGDTDDPEVTPEEPEMTPYASCMHWCQWDGGSWKSCHRTCKKLVEPVTAQQLSGAKEALSIQ